MKSAITLKEHKINHLKVVKNNNVTKKESVQKVYINTLEPNFKYKNSKGEEVITINSFV
jgi:hypothetical protein